MTPEGKLYAVAPEVDQLRDLFPQYEWLTRMELNKLLFEGKYSTLFSTEKYIEDKDLRFHIVKLNPVLPVNSDND
jgi:hypothetical protein